MSNAKAPPAEESKRLEDESMQQHPTAPPASSVEPVPMGPPPTYSEAMNSAAPYPPMPSVSAAPYPTAAPYPVTDSSMPLPVTQPASAPYPVNDAVIPATMPVPSQPQPMGFISPIPPPSYQNQQPIMNQPTAAYANEEYVHPKNYVVLRDNRRTRRGVDDECSCTDWMLCCWCCVESCRCLMLCLECIAECNK